MNLTDLLQNQLDIKPTNSSLRNTNDDLFAALDDINTSSVNQAPSAASKLLEEKKKLKQQLDQVEATNFSLPKAEAHMLTPLMQQVAENQSTYDFTKHSIKKPKSKVQVYQPSKKSMKLKEKGEAYNDRLQQKLGKKSKLKK
jgi:hypothetical protein